MLKYARILILAMVITLVGTSAIFAADAPTPNEKTLYQSKKLARVGKVIGSDPFGLGSSKKKIINTFGQPEETDGYFLYYKSRGLLFSTDGKTVNQVTSYHERLTKVTLNEVLDTLKKPYFEREEEGQYIIGYKVGLERFLFFETPQPTESNPNPHVQSATVN